MATKYVNGTLGTDDGSHGGTEGTGAWKTLHYALEYGGLAHGDVVYMAAGTYDSMYASDTGITITISGTYTGSNPVQVIGVGEVIITIPTAASGTWAQPAGSGDCVAFHNVKFKNINSKVVNWFGFYYGLTTKFFDCEIDCGGVACKAFSATGSGTITLGVYLDNTSVHNSTTDLIFGNTGITRFNISLQNNSKLYNCQRAINCANGSPVSLDIDDSCVVSTVSSGIYLAGASHIGINIADSVLCGRYNDAHSGIFPVLTGDAAFLADIKANPSKLVLSGNKLWNFGTLATDNNFGGVLAETADYFIACDETNVYSHPGFELTDVAANEFTPDYVLPTMPPVSNGVAAFFGDSIMRGQGATSKDDPAVATAAWAVFGRNQGFEMVPPITAAIPGMAVATARFHIDRLLQAVVPQYVFVAIGLNNCLGDDVWPNEMAVADIVEAIRVILAKIKNAGATPVWLGISASGSSNNTDNIAVNTGVAAVCTSIGAVYGVSLFDLMMQNTAWATAYYADLAVDIHPNNDGHALIAEAAEILLTLDRTGMHWGLRVPFDGTIPTLTTGSKFRLTRTVVSDGPLTANQIRKNVVEALR